ncbi:MAG TPA: transporter substrate-binding domain-containing protein [Spirochaetota bacterium]|nr:transporter substrate-binding domain-containing protein [Spirochaetota bacterium]
MFFRKNFIKTFTIFFILIFSLCCKNKEPSIDRPNLDKKEINVIMDNNYPPYIFLDENNNLKGILIDQWHLWEKKTGIKVNIVATDWIEAQNLMKQGKFDVIDTIFKTEERLKIYDYSKPYAKIRVPIFYHKNISGIIDAPSLKGFNVAVKEGDACIDVLKSYSITNLIEYKSYEDIIKAAKNRDVVIFVVDESPVYYFMYKYGIQNEFKDSPPLYTGEFHRAVLKGNKDLLNLIEYGFAQISKKEYNEIEEKWFGKNKVEFNLKYFLLFSGIFLGSIVLFFIILFLMMFWNFSLKNIVNARTFELRNEIEKNLKIQKELEESKRLYKLLSEITSDAASLLTIQPDGSFKREWYTTALIVEYGYKMEDIDSFEKWAKIVYKDDIDIYKNGIKRVLNGEKVSVDLRIVKSDNKIRWINNTVIPIKNIESGRVERLLISIKDITDRKRIEEELRLAKEEAERLANIKSQFLSNMSHEIRNPLNGILGMINMLIKTDLSDTQKEYIDMLKTSSETLLNIVNDILDLAKIEAGKRVIRNEVIKIKNLCLGLVNSFKIATESKNLKLNFIYDNDLPKYIIGDPSCLNQIFLNLLSNAVKFTEKGGITFEVKKIKEDEKTVDIVFIVKDTGIGIPNDKLNDIFGKFIQLETSYNKKYKGTGLGLTIVKEIIDLLGGEIIVESKEKEGTTFLIKLKFEKYNYEVIENKKDEAKAIINEKEYNIIIAEDNAINYLFLEAMLKDKAYNVFGAKNGKEVLDLVEKNKIDLILMDIQMPVLNGIDCTKILRNEKKFKNPIVALTGYTMPEDLKVFKDAGVDDYIIKPIDEDETLKKIAKLLLTLNK